MSMGWELGLVPGPSIAHGDPTLPKQNAEHPAGADPTEEECQPFPHHAENTFKSFVRIKDIPRCVSSGC